VSVHSSDTLSVHPYPLSIIFISNNCMGHQSQFWFFQPFGTRWLSYLLWLFEGHLQIVQHHWHCHRSHQLGRQSAWKLCRWSRCLRLVTDRLMQVAVCSHLWSHVFLVWVFNSSELMISPRILHSTGFHMMPWKWSHLCNCGLTTPFSCFSQLGLHSLVLTTLHIIAVCLDLYLYTVHSKHIFQVAFL